MLFTPSLFGENLFDGFFDDFAKPVKNGVRLNSAAAALMRTDVKETEKGYDLEIDLPGYQKEDLQAELKDGYLTIKAQTSKKDEEKKDGKYICRERYFGSCQRTYFVGEDVQKEDIKARFENGILKISVPKKEAKPEVEENRFIAIEG